jgi:hypothetical protein
METIRSVRGSRYNNLDRLIANPKVHHDVVTSDTPLGGKADGRNYIVWDIDTAKARRSIFTIVPIVIASMTTVVPLKAKFDGRHLYGQPTRSMLRE